MKTTAFIFTLTLSWSAVAEEQTFEKKAQLPWGGIERTAWGVAYADIHRQTLTSCPSGFEKLREYTTREGDEYFLHFVVRCITPATPAAAQK
jgi:hypothetical protein